MGNIGSGYPTNLLNKKVHSFHIQVELQIIKKFEYKGILLALNLDII